MSLLEAESITKRFAGIRALSSVDLSVEEGQFVGLIGPNGAGKTTLFNCLYGLLRPDDGQVLFGGHDITRMAVYKRARLGFGRTFQRMELFGGMTAREHLLVAARASSHHLNLVRDLVWMGRPTAAERQRADEVMELLELTSDADRPIEALSLGRARLVELGRALMTQPRLLFLDEPSSGLDRHETAEVADVLVRVNQERGTAILLVEHDIVTVQRLTTELYVLDYGTVIAHGPTAEVMQDSRVREAYLGVTA